MSLLKERNNLRVFFVEVQILLIVTEDQVHTPLQVVSMEKKQLKDFAERQWKRIYYTWILRTLFV